MGRKKKKTTKPWCWYCNREFEDEKILLQHQKAKHFKCHICHKKLFTGPGLQIHCMQVHKENIEKVPNSIKGRDNITLEICGMENIPEEDLIEHEKQKLLQSSAARDETIDSDSQESIESSPKPNYSNTSTTNNTNGATGASSSIHMPPQLPTGTIHGPLPHIPPPPLPPHPSMPPHLMQHHPMMNPMMMNPYQTHMMGMMGMPMNPMMMQHPMMIPPPPPPPPSGGAPHSLLPNLIPPPPPHSAPQSVQQAASHPPPLMGTPVPPPANISLQPQPLMSANIQPINPTNNANNPNNNTANNLTHKASQYPTNNNQQPAAHLQAAVAHLHLNPYQQVNSNNNTPTLNTTNNGNLTSSSSSPATQSSNNNVPIINQTNKIENVAAGSKLIHPEEDISLEEFRASHHKYKYIPPQYSSPAVPNPQAQTYIRAQHQQQHTQNGTNNLSNSGIRY